MAICISVLKVLNLSVCHILVFDNAESLILLNPLLIYLLQAKIENISGYYTVRYNEARWPRLKAHRYGN